MQRQQSWLLFVSLPDIILAFVCITHRENILVVKYRMGKCHDRKNNFSLRVARMKKSQRVLVWYDKRLKKYISTLHVFSLLPRTCIARRPFFRLHALFVVVVLNDKPNKKNTEMILAAKYFTARRRETAIS